MADPTPNDPWGPPTEQETQDAYLREVQAAKRQEGTYADPSEAAAIKRAGGGSSQPLDELEQLHAMVMPLRKAIKSVVAQPQAFGSNASVRAKMQGGLWGLGDMAGGTIGDQQEAERSFDETGARNDVARAQAAWAKSFLGQRATSNPQGVQDHLSDAVVLPNDTAPNALAKLAGQLEQVLTEINRRHQSLIPDSQFQPYDTDHIIPPGAREAVAPYVGGSFHSTLQAIKKIQATVSGGHQDNDQPGDNGILEGPLKAVGAVNDAVGGALKKAGNAVGDTLLGAPDVLRKLGEATGWTQPGAVPPPAVPPLGAAMGGGPLQKLMEMLRKNPASGAVQSAVDPAAGAGQQLVEAPKHEADVQAKEEGDQLDKGQVATGVSKIRELAPNFQDPRLAPYAQFLQEQLAKGDANFSAWVYSRAMWDPKFQSVIRELNK